MATVFCLPPASVTVHLVQGLKVNRFSFFPDLFLTFSVSVSFWMFIQAESRKTWYNWNKAQTDDLVLINNYSCFDKELEQVVLPTSWCRFDKELILHSTRTPKPARNVIHECQNGNSVTNMRRIHSLGRNVLPYLISLFMFEAKLLADQRVASLHGCLALWWLKH